MGSIRVASHARNRIQISGPRHAGRHPIENDKIGRRVGEPSYGSVAAIDAFDDIAFGLEIVRERKKHIAMNLVQRHASWSSTNPRITIIEGDIALAVAFGDARQGSFQVPSWPSALKAFFVSKDEKQTSRAGPHAIGLEPVPYSETSVMTGRMKGPARCVSSDPEVRSAPVIAGTRSLPNRAVREARPLSGMCLLERRRGWPIARPVSHSRGCRSLDARQCPA
jgi:hypothetical protein